MLKITLPFPNIFEYMTLKYYVDLLKGQFCWIPWMMHLTIISVEVVLCHESFFFCLQIPFITRKTIARNSCWCSQKKGCGRWYGHGCHAASNKYGVTKLPRLVMVGERNCDSAVHLNFLFLLLGKNVHYLMVIHQTLVPVSCNERLLKLKI